MCRTAANLQHLALYLAAGIEVENAAQGRGHLVGLPFQEIAEEQRAEVLYPAHVLGWDMWSLERVKPVLYAPADRVRVLAGHPDRAQYADVLRLSLEELERMARIVDATRALGIALNIAPQHYIRKDISRA